MEKCKTLRLNKVIIRNYHQLNKTSGKLESINDNNLVLQKKRITFPIHHHPTFSDNAQEFEIETNCFPGNPTDKEGRQFEFTHKIKDKRLEGQLQREFYISLTCLQKHKLEFMFGNHWLNKSENIKWLIGNIIFILLAIVGWRLSWVIAHLHST